MPIRLERIYADHAQALFSFLMNFTRNEADTRDVLQEVFCKLAERPRLLDGARNERVFLVRLSHNLAVDQMRRRAAREKNHAEFAKERFQVFALSPPADAACFEKALSDALQELPPAQRAVAHLKLWEGATFEEIAESLEISVNTAASRYRYAIDKLRQQLRPIYEEMK